jgi:nucleoside-diphosphate-sugar epimerase
VNRLRVLVLGAHGFVGRRLTAMLGMTNWASCTADGGIDVPTPENLPAALAASDAVVNAAQGGPAGIRRAADILFDHAERAAARPRIVHLSSMTVYGSAVGDIDESAELRADLGDYSAAQLAGERRAAAYANCVVLRPGCEYGPSCPDWSERIARLLLARRLGDLGAAGDGYCNLIYLDDLVGAIMAALRAPGIEGQAFNLANPQPPTWNEYFTLFAQALGAVPLRRIGRRRLRWETKVFAPPLRIAELIARRLPLPVRTPAVLSPSLARLCEQEIRLNSRKAEQLLGLRCADLAQGLAQAALAWREATRAPPAP